MNEDYIISFLLGHCSEFEEKALFEWLEENEANKEKFFTIRTLYGYLEHRPDDDRLELEEALKCTARKIDTDARNKRKAIFNSWSFASILVAAAVCLTLVLFREKPDAGVQECSFYNPDSASMLITLPDESVVWLGKNSYLSYSSSFLEQRKVELEGEACFDVSHDAHNPFSVEAPGIEVKVLGTLFNVRSFHEESHSTITLAEGRVVLLNAEGENLINLSPGQRAVYFEDNDLLQVTDVEVDNLLMLKYGLVSLDNMSIMDIFEFIEQKYGVRLKVDMPQESDSLYTLNFRNDSPLEDIVLALGTVLGRKVIIE